VTALFYIAAVVAVISTLMVVTRGNLVHALLYLVISLFAVAVVFYTLGAPFVAALEVIVYAGAIMMLFLFAVMLLNVGADSPLRVPGWAWVAPGILVGVLLAEVIYGLTRQTHALAGAEVGPGAVSEALYGPYVLGVELASMLLLAALIGARHVAARSRDEQEAREAAVLETALEATALDRPAADTAPDPAAVTPGPASRQGSAPEQDSASGDAPATHPDAPSAPSSTAWEGDA
jgi:NADH-quinone oxidoreductase subunit J